MGLFSLVESQISIPDGWQKPKDKLFFQEWRKQNKFQYLSFGADLNCDGLTDLVMILESKENNGIGLFLFLRGQNEKYSQLQLYDSHKDSSNNDKDLTENQRKQIQKQFKPAYGIDTVPPGLYKTACGKGYYDCKESEPEELLLKCSGINFFLSEGADSFYYWDTIRNKFLHVWISICHLAPIIRTYCAGELNKENSYVISNKKENLLKATTRVFARFTIQIRRWFCSAFRN